MHRFNSYSLAKSGLLCIQYDGTLYYCYYCKLCILTVNQHGISMASMTLIQHFCPSVGHTLELTNETTVMQLTLQMQVTIFHTVVQHTSIATDMDLFALVKFLIFLYFRILSGNSRTFHTLLNTNPPCFPLCHIPSFYFHR